MFTEIILDIIGGCVAILCIVLTLTIIWAGYLISIEDIRRVFKK